VTGEELRERLRRLRREEPAVADAPRGDAALPAWFRERMRRREALPPPSSASAAGVAPPRDLEEARNALGEFAQRTASFDAAHRHGALALGDALGADAAAFALLMRDRTLASFDPRRAVFLDIETTGLSGGAGTKAFLVALGRFDGERFDLWQGFLRGPEEERALLAECAERIAACDAVVSFFGKSFDRHRLEDKMRYHGVAPPFAGRPHLDLYHPSRKLWGRALADARLATIERAACGVEREDDLPGAFAPQAWVDFVAGRPHALERVFAHNQDDVLSLVALFARLGRALDPGEREHDGRLFASRAAAIARELARERRFDECARWCEIAESAGGDTGDAREVRALRARSLGACARAAESLALWREVASSARDALAARAAYEAARCLVALGAPRQEIEAELSRAIGLATANAGARDAALVLARATRGLARLRG
jgi:hypothetical protein